MYIGTYVASLRIFFLLVALVLEDSAEFPVPKLLFVSPLFSRVGFHSRTLLRCLQSGGNLGSVLPDLARELFLLFSFPARTKSAIPLRFLSDDM